MNEAPLYLLREHNVAARRIGDELMIMSAKDSALFSLNETAAILWEAADGNTALADIVARGIVAPAELPIGVVTAVLGAPVFLWILLRRAGTGAI